MKHIYFLILLVGFIFAFSSCKEKTKNEDIITKVPLKKKQQKGPILSSTAHWDKTIDWNGNSYSIIIDRMPDTKLTLTEDESGQKYFDNKVHLQIVQINGKTLVDKWFYKADFQSFSKSTFEEHSAFLGIAYDKQERGNLLFGASVGSPDPNSDEYIPFDIIITPSGKIEVKGSAQSAGTSPSKDSLNKKNELDLSEEEGI